MADIYFSSAVEGDLDEAVVRRLILHVGANAGDIYGKKGKLFLRGRIGAYNSAAKHERWLVLVDLDHDADCPSELREAWLPAQSALMCFRVVVREIEAWLLADPASLASFLRVSKGKIPDNPEQLDEPKQSMVNIARHSRSSQIYADMVPREGSGRSVGPAYSSRLIEFASAYWDPVVAAKSSPSLARAIRAMESMCK